MVYGLVLDERTLASLNVTGNFMYSR